MNQKIDDKVILIGKTLRKSGVGVFKHPKGVAVKLDSDSTVVVYALPSNPDHIRARIKIHEDDPLKRQTQVEQAYDSLSKRLKGVARLEVFKVSRESGGVCVYNSVISIGDGDDGQSIDEPVEVSSEAIEIIDEDIVQVEESGTADFELNFDLLVKSNMASVMKFLLS